MFCYQEKVNAGVPQVCTPEIWDSLIDSPAVANTCAAIAALDSNATDYADRKQALKKRLPIIIPHAASFKNGRRVSADGIPSGLAMLDVDHVDNPREAYLRLLPEGKSEEWFVENGIYLVAITASGQGLRVIGRREQAESIESAQMRMAQVLGIKEYDAVTKDLARASYVVPRKYILWIYEAGLFAEEERKDLLQLVSFLPALPPHQEEKDTSHEETPIYRGIPYADIVQQLMLAMGAAGGAEIGERNTVYFSLANYMRYICDFNADLLLAILPDFGLSESERRQAISSAIGRPRKSQTPVIVQSAIAICERESLSGAPNVRSENIPSSSIHRIYSLGTT